MATTQWIPPIKLLEIAIADLGSCPHLEFEAVQMDHIQIQDQQKRPYIAVYTKQCKSCLTLVQEWWQTAYETYQDGIDAIKESN